jgi:hypothetical protein
MRRCTPDDGFARLRAVPGQTAARHAVHAVRVTVYT